MTRSISAKYKLSRKLGVNLWISNKARTPFDKKPYKPGQRYDKGERKLSEYGMQLAEKQKLRAHYGNINEKQFRRFFVNAKSKKGDVGRNFVSMLERRLDAAVYRLKLASTIFAARQLVSHNHINVNGQRVNRGSYILNEGDVVSVAEKSISLCMIRESVNSSVRTVPSYFEVEGSGAEAGLKAKLVRVPQFEEIPYPMTINLNLVVEWYFRYV